MLQNLAPLFTDRFFSLIQKCDVWFVQQTSGLTWICSLKEWQVEKENLLVLQREHLSSVQSANFPCQVGIMTSELQTGCLSSGHTRGKMCRFHLLSTYVEASVETVWESLQRAILGFSPRAFFLLESIICPSLFLFLFLCVPSPTASLCFSGICLSECWLWNLKLHYVTPKLA